MIAGQDSPRRKKIKSDILNGERYPKKLKEVAMKRMHLIGIAAILYVIEPVLCPAPVFMKYDGVDGSVQDTDHKKWILIESMSSPMTRAGGSASQPTFGPITITKELDKSSPKLMLTCATGIAGQGATIDFMETLESGGERRYLQYTLSDVLISSYSFHGKAEPTSGDPIPTEQLSLNFEEIKIEYGGIRKTYFVYDANGDLEEIISEGVIARPGGTIPPIDLPPPTVTDSMTISGPEEATPPETE
jgi:type VI secretion system secreted protein Hcp